MRKLASPLFSGLSLISLLFTQQVHADIWSEQTHKAHTGDFNGDGFSDLFLQPKDASQPVQIVLGLGDTNYTAPIQEWGNSDLGANWLEANTIILVGDFDGDGRDELLLQPKSGASLQIFAPDTDGSFTAEKYNWPVSYAGVDWSYATSHLLIGDFDGDGRDDVLLQSKAQSGQNASVLSDANGKPKTSAHQIWGNDHLGYNWSLPYRNLIVGDYNGDGRDDLILQEKITVITVPLGAGGAPMPLVIRDGLGHAMVQTANDFFVAGSAGKFLGVISAWQDGDYGLDWNSSAATLLAADFNGDGVSELLVQGNGSANKILQPQTNPQTYTTEFVTTQSWQDSDLGADWTSSSNLLIADVNGDGRSDVLIQAKGTSTTSRTALAGNSGTLTTATAAVWSEPPVFASNYAVGAIGGDISVGPGGGASYSIPIVVPPGIGDMQPDLSLTYSSLSNNGIAGVGWSLGGVSSIQRCGKTLEQDGSYASVTMGSGDRLCLDGVRLVAVSGAYGAANTEYRTEIDNYSKIVQNDASCGYACRFTVYTKAGQTYEYGAGTGSQQLLDGKSTPLSWSVNRISDSVGNAIVFNYTQTVSEGSQRLDSISYTERSGLPPQGLVKFSYNDRPDSSAGYLLGSSLKSTQRLTNIAVNFAGKAVRSYDIRYQQGKASGLSLIDQVKECVAPGSPNEQCFVPTHFTWADTPSRVSAWSARSSNSTIYEATRRCKGIVQGDVNGDGRTDLICAFDTDTSGNSARETYVRLSTGDRYTDWQKWFGSGKGGFDLQNCISIQPADFNGDGLTDLACLVADSRLYVQLALTNQSFTDWGQWGSSASLGQACSGFEIGDVNADGYSDVICPTENTSGGTDMNVLTSDGSRFTGWSNWGTSATVAKSLCRNLYSGDANGDGRTDMICAYDTSPGQNSGPALTYVWLSNGTQFDVQLWNSGSNSEELQNCSKQTSADVNGDGLTDLVCPYTWNQANDWYMKVQLSTGSG